MAFRVGQKVETIADWGTDFPFNVPKMGVVYTVAVVTTLGDGEGLILAEVQNPPMNIWSNSPRSEPSFSSEYFRPIVERKTDTGFAILTEILNGQRVPEKV